MTTIQYDLGGGATIALPADIAVKQLIEQLQRDARQATTQPRPQIGEYLSGQGGIYVGDIRGNDGVTYGLITPKDEDIGRAKWGAEGELDLSDWDGLSNTNILRADCPAAKLASDYEADGHVDFYLPAHREMLIAMANVPHLFGKDSWYWSSTPYGSYNAWAVDFEIGDVLTDGRYNEFRVLPFRRFTH
ncbi:hypothetical protein ACMHYJ_14310 [Castellaniella hirudinis]|uniref:hypothetical protein n=1 Tax=Castellaniella hirudinis TaxID=1144617 RepID=UPI0039C3EBD6